MGAICISYRPEDTAEEARDLHRELVQRFGEGAVRLSADGPGSEAQLGSGSVLLAVIGRRWLYAMNDAGRRRIDDPQDGVRVAALSALRLDVPLVPVLVQGAHMPHAALLPVELAELAFRNAVELTRAHWSSDVSVLARVLSRHVALVSSLLRVEEPVASGARRRRLAMAAAALTLALLGLAGLAYAMRPRPQPATTVPFYSWVSDDLSRNRANLDRDGRGEVVNARHRSVASAVSAGFVDRGAGLGHPRAAVSK
jgi:hypothetical protein